MISLNCRIKVEAPNTEMMMLGIALCTAWDRRYLDMTVVGGKLGSSHDVIECGS